MDESDIFDDVQGPAGSSGADEPDVWTDDPEEMNAKNVDIVDSDEDAAQKPAKSKKQKNGREVVIEEDDADGCDQDEDEDGDEDEDDEDDEDDDDDDDDADEDVDDDTQRRKRPFRPSNKEKKINKAAKRAKRAARSFFLDEAEDADGSDEEDGEWERGATEGEELNEEEKAANALVEERHRKNREMLQTDAAEIAARYERKHRQDKERAAAMREVSSRGGSGVGAGIVNQQALLPDYNDPPIFRIKCVPSMEMQLIRSIFLKHIDARSRGETRSTLKSAFCSASKGYIYVEAGSEVHARQAVLGLRGLYVRSFAKVPLGKHTFWQGLKTSA